MSAADERAAAVAALRTVLTQPEPQMPECHLCSSTTGPWVPDPSNVRWPSGAQMLICSRGCKTDASES